MLIIARPQAYVFVFQIVYQMSLCYKESVVTVRIYICSHDNRILRPV